MTPNYNVLVYTPYPHRWRRARIVRTTYPRGSSPRFHVVLRTGERHVVHSWRLRAIEVRS